MGIESDQLVFDYLSRVGDLAQQRQLPSGTRMRLVSELRGEIDRYRAKATADSPASVRRILDRLGSPESVVAGSTTDGGSGVGASESRAAVPTQRAQAPESRPKGLRRVVPRPRPAEPDVPAPSPPHLASTDELGSAQPDWWRVDSSPFGTTDSVPGFVGGVEIPELLRPTPGKKNEPNEPNGQKKSNGQKEPNRQKEPDGPDARSVPLVVQPAALIEAVEKKPRRFAPRLRPAGGGWTNPILLLAAALLVVGAAVGNPVMLGLGWLIAYLSRRLSPAESKWAVLVVPGMVATAGIVWLWGRTEGRWGTPIAEGQMNDALAQTWPWVLRGAAIASALYLVWRSQRPRP